MPKGRKASSARRNSTARTSKARQRRFVERLKRLVFVGVSLLMAVTVLAAWLGGEDGLAARWRDEWVNRPRRLQAVIGRRVAIIAGHKGHDSGAICPDGLTEQETVEQIAGLTAERLRRSGAEVLVLAEYDERLQGLVADALVSVHADSCIDRSGFKAARAQTSTMPEVEDRLVACLTQEYAAATGLAFDADTITADMTEYHAFKRVASGTPAAIIEVGFLGGDRQLLTFRSDLAARGIAQGVLCFLQPPS